MAVAGTTYDYTSYGENPSWWKLLTHPNQIFSWMLRGNYGPAAIMSPMKAVSAYAPNVLKAESRSKHSNEQFVRDISLNGAGTSNSTPQVPGAASIWLQINRLDIENQNMWGSWKKAEAVYQAVSVCSADKTANPYGVRTLEFQEHFGAGHLKANDALKQKFPSNAATKFEKRAESRIGSTWLIDTIASTGFSISSTSYKTSLILESVQFATIDKGLSSAMAAVEQCIHDPSRDDEKSCQKIAVDFINKLKAYPHISQDLRDALEKIKLGNISKVVNKTDDCKLEKKSRDQLRRRSGVMPSLLNLSKELA